MQKLDIKTIELPKLKQKIINIKLNEKTSLNTYKQRLKTKAKQTFIQKKIQLSKLKSKFDDPVIAVREIKKKTIDLGKITSSMRVLSTLLSNRNVQSDRIRYAGLKYQYAQLNKQRQNTAKEIKILKSKTQDKIIGLTRLSAQDSLKALILLRATLSANTPLYKYINEQINIKEGLIKTGTTTKPTLKLKLSWRTEPKDKRYTYMTNGLIKTKGKIKELQLKTTPYRALKYMANLVDNTTSRSFALKIVGLLNKKDIPKPNLKKFRFKISRDPKVLLIVEKSKYSIDTIGEKRGLKVNKYLKRNRK